MGTWTGEVSDADQAIAAQMEAVADPWPDATVIDTEAGGTAGVAGESVDQAVEAIRPSRPGAYLAPRPTVYAPRVTTTR